MAPPALLEAEPALNHPAPAGLPLTAAAPAGAAGCRFCLLHAKGTAMAHQWPLRDFLEYGALPSALPSARLHARQIAWEGGLSALGENVELLVSELMTNGIAAARAIKPISPVRLWLLADTTRILILVWDANPHPPAPVQANEHAESGRGLLLVQALSQQW